MNNNLEIMILSAAEIREMSIEAMRDYIRQIDDAVIAASAEHTGAGCLTYTEAEMYMKIYSELLNRIQSIMDTAVNIPPELLAQAKSELEEEEQKIAASKINMEKGRKGFTN